MDNRAGVSIGLSRFFLGLIVAAPVTWIVWLVTEPIYARSKNATTNSSANQATTWLSNGSEWLPIGFLLISAMGLLVLAIYRREVLR